MRIIFFFLLISLNTLYSQLNLPVNDSLQNFLFAKSTLDTPIIITENGIFEYLSDWEYTSFVDNSFKKELDNTSSKTERKKLYDHLVSQAYEKGKAINAASKLEIDEVIDPKETRSRISNSLLNYSDQKDEQNFIDSW